MSSKVKQITDESFYRKRLASVDPIWEEYYLGVAKKLIEQGYESPRLLDNIIEALPRELDPEFYSIMYKINPRLNENADLAEKKSARAIVRHLATIGFFEGKSYGLYKGSGKPGGAMKDFLDKKAKKLEKQRASQSDAAKNNPHFDSTQPSPSGRNKYEEVKLDFNEKRNLGDRMERKMKLMKKTTAKAMDFARNEGEASGHARYNMSRLGNEMEKLGKKRREANEEKSFQQFQEKCWPGYEKKGMKTMFGKRYPNCVKKKK